jgi:tetratricopeptide (TPR) repeat protein
MLFPSGNHKEVGTMYQPGFRRTPLLAFAVSLVLTVLGHQAAPGSDKAALAKKVKAVLKANCYRCHGDNGANEGGFNYLLDRGQLVARTKVVPGNPRLSRLFQKVSSGDMPPPEVKKPRPSGPEIALLRQWIEQGAQDFNAPVGERRFISPADQLDYIKADLEKLPRRERSSARYFTLTHLYNAGQTEDQLQSYRHALSKLINSLSWSREIARPRPVGPGQTILRIDLDDYEWNDRVWEQILAAYPYGVTYGTATARYCYSATECKLPHVRADWFVFAASRPPLYHDLLHLPKTDRELEKELKVDVAENIRRQRRVARAGFNGSGVSRNNRLLERHNSGHGAYWKSYDFAGSTQKKNLFAHPLGPAGENVFQQDGGEIIFNLPNGLQAYMLVDSQGKRLNEGPINIVSVKNRPNPTVINGISCMACHAQGMIEKEDQVRSHVLNNSGDFTAAERAAVLTMYPVREDFLALVRQDAARYLKAVAKTGAPLAATEPVAALADRFENEMDLKSAAAEAGVPVAAFVKGLRSGKLARGLGILKVEGATVKRDVFEGAFASIIREFQPGGVWARENALAQHALDEGQKFLKERAYDRALARFTEAVRFSPQTGRDFITRGVAYFSRGRAYYGAYGYKAGRVRALADYGRAIADFDRAVQADPKDANAYHKRGTAYRAQGNHDRAIADFTQALSLEPNNVEFYFDRAASYTGKKEYDKALADYTKAINEKQSTRLDQLYLQFTAPYQLTRAKAAKALNLTKVQQKKFKDLYKQYRKEMGVILFGKDTKGRAEKFAKLRQKTRTKILSILTKKQQAQARKVVGPPGNW